MYKYLTAVFGIVAGLMFSVPCDAISPQAQWTIGQTVQTSSGPVRGHAASHASNVSEYLGIPYALAPVGSLRFQPPVRYRGNTTISGETFVGGALFTKGQEPQADYDRVPHAFLRI